MRTSVRRGLIHPNDIKTVGLGSVPPAPATAPLPISTTSATMGRSPSSSLALRQKPSRPQLAAISTPLSPISGPASARSYSAPYGAPHSHSRSTSSGGSYGRGEAETKLREFVKYAEDEEEDYDDIFGKANSTGKQEPLHPLVWVI
jgi:hypothetical protein